MSEKQSTDRLPKLSKLSVAIIEHLVKPAIGETAIKEIKAPLIEKELLDSLVKALEETERQFVADYDDPEVREGILSLPLATLPIVIQAVRNFYLRPNDTALSQVLREQLSATFRDFSSERINSGVEKYIQILRAELINLSSEIREKLTAHAILRIADALEDNSNKNRETIHKVIATCYRRAIFTRTHAQLSIEAMFESVAQCRTDLQKLVTYIQPKEMRQLVIGIIEELEKIERCKGWSKLIDESKLRIISSLQQLGKFASIPYELPSHLTEEIFFTQEEANKAPHVGG